VGGILVSLARAVAINAGMAADSHLDLAKLDHWHGLRPGMSRAEVRAVMIAAGLDPAGDASDATNLDIYDWGMELRFAADGTDRLRQILLDDEDTRWSGQPLLGVPLDTALRTLGTAGDGARWRPEDAADADDLAAPPPGPFSDEALLREGTVWLPSLRLGLVFCAGLVNQIVWRDAPDVPRETIGPVTAAQRQISLRPDLDEYLRNEWVSHRRWSMLDLSRLVALRDEAPYASDDAAPDEAVAAHRETARIERAIASLPPALREALLLVAVEGLEQKEAADVLGIKYDLLRQRLTRARERLAELVRGDEPSHTAGEPERSGR